MDCSKQGRHLLKDGTKSKQDRRRIIGLAGPMAAGKDLAADILAQKGFTILDVDALGHIALENTKEKIISLFANEARTRNIRLTNEDGSINRHNLGIIVFANKQNLHAHEAIVHPQINHLIEYHLNSHPNTSYVINAAILYKFSIITQCDCVIFIDAPYLVRLKRVKKRNNMPIMHIFKRFFAQIKIFDKCKKLNADIYRVENSKTKKSLEHKIEKILVAY